MSENPRFFPSSFDALDPTLRGIPRPASWRWRRLEEALATWGSHGVMMRLPLFWQLEVPAFLACRTAGAFLFTNDTHNMPLGRAAVHTAEIDTIVTELSDAIAFSQHLSAASTSIPPHWFIIRRCGDDTPIPHLLRTVSVVEEVHLSPGVPENDI